MNPTEYLPNENFALLTSRLLGEINARQIALSQCNMLRVLRDTMDSGKFHLLIDWVIHKDYTDGLRKRMWTSEIIKALRQGFAQGGWQLRSLASELYRKCVDYGMSYMCIVRLNFLRRFD